MLAPPDIRLKRLSPVQDELAPTTVPPRVGLVANTSEPVPVSSVTAASRLLLLGVARNVATPVPSVTYADVPSVPPVPTFNVELSVPVNVSVLLAVKVFPSAMVNVALVAGAVIVTLLTDVAVATARLLVVPTKSAFCVLIPPAVMIEPVRALVASVVSVELTPNANGTRAVVVVCPSLVIAVLRPVPRSAVSALKTELEITVPVTTGWPVLLMTNVPEPL
jgi:hypothetical protein